ncbi:MAG: DUF255 domain-containing protein [Bacillota bacterium]|nr:DUF255 domain-containing protein [Bacillota bacterium]
MSSSSQLRWRSWSAAVLDEAARSRRPLFLFLSPAWAEATHRYEDGALADRTVQGVLAERYVPVRVDPDRRPDLDARYNLGGWPTLAVLAPGGDLLAAANLAEPSRLAAYLAALAEEWGARQPVLERHLERYRLPDQLPELLTEPGAGWVAELEEGLLRQYDPEHAGFGGAPKFLPLEPLEALAALPPRELPERLRSLLPATLAALEASPLHDPRGGFRRLAAEADWSDPVGERLLADNARLLAVTARLARPEAGWADELEAAGFRAAKLAGELVGFLRSMEGDHGWAAAFDAVPGPGGRAVLSAQAPVGAASQAARALFEAEAAGLGRAARARAFLEEVDRELPAGPGAALRLPHDLPGVADPEPSPLRGYLGDLAPLGRAFLAAWAAGGRIDCLRRSLELAAGALESLRSGTGALHDLPEEAARALGLRRAAAYPALNAEAALWFLTLADALSPAPAPRRRALPPAGRRALENLPSAAELLEAARAILAWGLPFAPTSGWQGAAWYLPLRLFLRLTAGTGSTPAP